MDLLPPDLATTHTCDLSGEVSWLDFGGPEGAPLLAGVHGLGGAAWNWAAVAPLLTEHVRFVALDLAGHGLTRSAGRATTVGANRRLLDRWLRDVIAEPVTLVGNSMGGAISLIEGARAADIVKGIVLVDPALPRPAFSRVDPRVAMSFAVVALPVVGEAIMTRRARRTGVEAQVRQTLKLCTVDVNRIPDWVMDVGIAYSKARGEDPLATRDFMAASRSVVRLLSRPGPLRQAAAAVDAAGIPVLLLHGEKDRLISVEVARGFARQHPDWRVEIADDLGHVPMLEDPKWTAEQILSWLPSPVST